MSLIINRVNGNSGRTAPGNDYYTGMIFYGNAPSGAGLGWATNTNPVSISWQQILSTSSATSAGILPNTDNTASTATFSITTAYAVGDTVSINCTFNQWNTSTNSIVSTETILFTLTIPSGTTTATTQATAIKNAINALTYSTGFSATSSVGVVTIIAPTYAGVLLNTGTPYAVVNTTSVGVYSLTQNVIAGTPSLYAAVYYHISEYYRLNPTGNLYIGFIASSSSWKETISLQIASGNQLKQIGIFDTNTSNGLAANLLSTVESIQSTVATCQTPYEVVYQPNIIAVSNLATLPNGNSNTTGTNVQIIITQDGAAQGALLSQSCGYSIGNLGANLGCLSASRVSASIAQPIQSFNVSNGIENNIPALANGALLSTISTSLYQQLFGTTSSNVNGYCYIGFAQYPGEVSGTFFSGNAMFTNQSSDYANMNDNRVWDKITRILQAAYTPYLNSEIQYQSSGVIDNNTIITLEGYGESAITAAMITGQTPPLISGSPNITINPNQNVQATSTLIIQCQIAENGIIRDIVISNGFSN